MRWITPKLFQVTGSGFRSVFILASCLVMIGCTNNSSSSSTLSSEAATIQVPQEVQEAAFEFIKNECGEQQRSVCKGFKVVKGNARAWMDAKQDSVDSAADRENRVEYRYRFYVDYIRSEKDTSDWKDQDVGLTCEKREGKQIRCDGAVSRF
jgi:hypothetical protein